MKSLRDLGVIAFLSVGFISCKNNMKWVEDWNFDNHFFSKAAIEGRDTMIKGVPFDNEVPLLAAIQNGYKGLQTETYYDEFVFAGRVPSPDGRSLLGTPITVGASVRREGLTFYAKENCMNCHSSLVGNTLMIGAANAYLNQRQVIKEVDDFYLQPSAEKGKDSPIITHMGELKKLIYRNVRTIGDNFGSMGVFVFIARFKDPENLGLVSIGVDEESRYENLMGDEPLGPVDANPWWTLKYKKVTYRYGDAAPNDAAHFTLNFTQPSEKPNETFLKRLPHIKKILQFANETRAPRYPGELDPALVELGRRVFHDEITLVSGNKARCATCHGTYERVDGWENSKQGGGWIVDYLDIREDVGTDPQYNQLMKNIGPALEDFESVRNYFKSIAREDATPVFKAPDSPGYMAPVLVGVWASAPYFHNGSVPTLEGVLQSNLRPKVWKRTYSNPMTYDLEKAGLPHEVLDDSDTYSEDMKTYNTRAPGRSNQGHTYGDDLSDLERRATLEFLKSLGGQELSPKYAN